MASSLLNVSAGIPTPGTPNIADMARYISKLDMQQLQSKVAGLSHSSDPYGFLYVAALRDATLKKQQATNPNTQGPVLTVAQQIEQQSQPVQQAPAAQGLGAFNVASAAPQAAPQAVPAGMQPMGATPQAPAPDLANSGVAALPYAASNYKQGGIVSFGAGGPPSATGGASAGDTDGSEVGGTPSATGGASAGDTDGSLGVFADHDAPNPHLGELYNAVAQYLPFTEVGAAADAAGYDAERNQRAQVAAKKAANSTPPAPKTPPTDALPIERVSGSPVIGSTKTSPYIDTALERLNVPVAGSRTSGIGSGAVSAGDTYEDSTGAPLTREQYNAIGYSDTAPTGAAVVGVPVAGSRTSGIGSGAVPTGAAAVGIPGAATAAGKSSGIDTSNSDYDVVNVNGVQMRQPKKAVVETPKDIYNNMQDVYKAYGFDPNKALQDRYAGLDKQDAAIENREAQNKKMAQIAGFLKLATMPTASKGLSGLMQGIATGAETGLGQYAAGEDKINAARDAATLARERMKDAQFQFQNGQVNNAALAVAQSKQAAKEAGVKQIEGYNSTYLHQEDEKHQEVMAKANRDTQMGISRESNITQLSMHADDLKEKYDTAILMFSAKQQAALAKAMNLGTFKPADQLALRKQLLTEDNDMLDDATKKWADEHQDIVKKDPEARTKYKEEKLQVMMATAIQLMNQRRDVAQRMAYFGGGNSSFSMTPQ